MESKSQQQTLKLDQDLKGSALGTSDQLLPRIVEERMTINMQMHLESGMMDTSASGQGQNVVEIEDVYLTYGRGAASVPVLQGVHMTIQKGIIYGLLGPSGCGKTTLLRCILGRLKPDEGVVRVFGAQPGTSESGIPGAAVGYMPQELALYTDFTIEETLMFFGRLYGIEDDALKCRIEQLIKFLDLPNSPGRVIGKLSGGQKRRVSLATALVHNPPLLILDEPTVGVDPLLRKSIWNHLVSLAKQGMTILITTHYIEEARHASIVGLMRHGKLMVQSTPQNLLTTHKLRTVEDVFLKLCVHQDTIANRGTPENVLERDIMLQDMSRHQPGGGDANGNETTVDVDHKPTTDSFASCVRRTGVLFNKNFVRLKRNLPLLFYQFLLPSLEVIIFCLCIGHNPINIPVAVVNQEPTSTYGDPLYGESYLREINNVTIKQLKHSTPEEAISSVRRGETWAAIVIRERFTSAMNDRMFAILSGRIDNETLQASKISVYMDLTNQIIAYTIQKTLLQAFVKFAQEEIMVGGMNPGLGEIPIVVEEPIYGSKEYTFTEFMAPGVVISISYLASVSLTALALVTEKKEGLLERNNIAGVGTTEFMVSHLMTQLIVMLVQVALLLTFTFFVFEVPTGGQFACVAGLTIAQGFCGMAYGLAISSICSEANSATMLALGSFYPNLLLSGIVWPIQAMPEFMRYVSILLPQTIPIESMRHMVSRGWGIYRVDVWIGFLVTFGWLAFFLVLSVIIFKFKK